MKRELWNKCDECGKIISFDDFAKGVASTKLVTPQSDLSEETYETLCKDHQQSRES